MTPVTQTKVVVRNSKDEVVVNGNCYAAAIASMLDLPITEVPNVEVLFKMDSCYWDDVMNKWLEFKGYRMDYVPNFIVYHIGQVDEQNWGIPENTEELKQSLKDEYYFVVGKSSRGVNHICIYKAGQMIHDPHPTRDGLISIEYFQQLTKL